MGTDISTYIEVKPSGDPAPTWRLVMDADADADAAVERDYDLFGCLFGVRNFANFQPLAEARGLPPAVSRQVQVRFQEDEDAWGHTWLSWAEFKAMDLDEQAERPDDRIHKYRREHDGRLAPVSKAAYDRDFSLVGGSIPTDQWVEGRQWEADGVVWRIERLRRSDVLDQPGPQWQKLFEAMERLAARYGDDNVRLVAWFHN
jgi:hypothetical protein